MEDGVQPLEAMIFTLNQINNDPKILPGIKLGMLAFDSCDSQSYGLEQSLNFVKGFFAHFNEFHEHEFQCNDGSTPKFRGGGFDQVVSVIGAQSSSVTIQLCHHPGKLSPTHSFSSSVTIQVNYHQHTPSPALSPSSPVTIQVNYHQHSPSPAQSPLGKLSPTHSLSSSVTIQVATMLRLFRVPLVSYMATSTSLSNKERFPYFFRTVPSDINQAHAMLEILRYYKMESCRYAGITTSHFGDVQRHIDGACFFCSVVVVFAEKITMFNLLDSARRTGYESRFVWIGSDAWVTSGHREPRGSQHSPDDEHLEESVLEGALAIQPLVQKLIGFDEYFKSLTLDHEKDNPWFREYWREYFKCGRKQRGKEVLGHASKSANEESEDYCMTSNKNLSHGGYKQQRYLHFVRDAVYSVAHALHDLQVYLCGAGKPGVCDSMKHIDGETLHGYLHNVSFNG
uniref:Receptor ligand binding region domain-containing protein n=1 Tax=Timema monikensis TaxID=170555 RepID=A0A7R9E559_9NEOP|nr:unnamed protein product [Timema monikensis]